MPSAKCNAYYRASRPRELTIEHEIFHLVYNFDEIPRVLSIRAWERGLDYEDWHGGLAAFEGQGTDPHFQGYFDENGRLMALFCHNSDVGDGWEREGENHEFFYQLLRQGFVSAGNQYRYLRHDALRGARRLVSCD